MKIQTKAVKIKLKTVTNSPEETVLNDGMRDTAAAYEASLVEVDETVLIEQLAELEHQQWMEWASSLLKELKPFVSHHLPHNPYNKLIEARNCGCNICQRIKRWESLMIPYSELPDAMKEHDRKWARIILQRLQEVEG